ncbi:MAG TPA: hypothetical protein VMN03_10175 [Burkholderiales bacterium]|nr:hypothetical protein [Burkholderiales bacterium]
MKDIAKRTPGRRLVPAVAAGVIALVLSGCGREEPPKPAAVVTPPPQAPAPAAKATPAPAVPAKPPAPVVRGPNERWEAAFRAADKNYDGGLSRKELDQTTEFRGIKKNFDAMDTNRDGKVTIAERQAWFNNKRAARRN